MYESNVCGVDWFTTIWHVQSGMLYCINMFPPQLFLMAFVAVYRLGSVCVVAWFLLRDFAKFQVCSVCAPARIRVASKFKFT